MLACRIKSDGERLRVALAYRRTEKCVHEGVTFITSLAILYKSKLVALYSRGPDISASHLSDRHMTPSKHASLILRLSMRCFFLGTKNFRTHNRLRGSVCLVRRVICVMDGCCMPNCIFWYHTTGRSCSSKFIKCVAPLGFVSAAGGRLFFYFLFSTVAVSGSNTSNGSACSSF